jgi:ribonuclease-3 family protein
MPRELFENINENISKDFNLNDEDILSCSPLVLAYIGDSVYELYIRSLLVSKNCRTTAHKLHLGSIKFVKAEAQSDFIHEIEDMLTPEEKNIVRRGRNAKSATVPKNANISDYRYATGFEALLGYLYLKKRYFRLMELLKMATNPKDNG